MNFKIFACVLAVASARPSLYEVPGASRSAGVSRSASASRSTGVSGRADAFGGSGAVSAPADIIPILRDERVTPEGGVYSFEFETGNGIKVSESGSPLDIEGNPTGQQGTISFTFPNGEPFELKFVANENGYLPESAHLPVAPAFPHPIPDFVQEQIEKAAREDADAAKAAASAPALAPGPAPRLAPGSALGRGSAPAPSGQYSYPSK